MRLVRTFLRRINQALLKRNCHQLTHTLLPHLNIWIELVIGVSQNLPGLSHPLLNLCHPYLIPNFKFNAIPPPLLKPKPPVPYHL